jgi:hypothetical protein
MKEDSSWRRSKEKVLVFLQMLIEATTCAEDIVLDYTTYYFQSSKIDVNSFVFPIADVISQDVSYFVVFFKGIRACESKGRPPYYYPGRR